MKVWRIATDTPDYTADDLSGRGAEMTGGRWNRKGTPLLYTSTSRALACLEVFAHLSVGVPLPLNRYLVDIEFPFTAWEDRKLFRVDVLVGWDAEPAGKVSLDWGDDWARSGRSLLAEVPSVIIPEESNILINPEHPDARELKCRKIRKWTFDQRVRPST